MIADEEVADPETVEPADEVITVEEETIIFEEAAAGKNGWVHDDYGNWYYYIDDVSVTPVGPTTQNVAKHNMPTPKTGEVKTLHGIFFATGKSDILPQSYNALQHLLELLRQHPDVHIELRGHTDNQGTADFNMRLSLARAEAVANYLIERGINAQRLSTQGFGKTMPIDSNDTPEGRSKNRRVEYQVIAN